MTAGPFYAGLRRFAAETVGPAARRCDAEQRLDPAVLAALRQHRYFATSLPAEAGGGGLDHISYGALHEVIGAECSATRSLLTAHDMVADAVWRWGGEELRARWLPSLTSGSALAGFALTEAGGGGTTGTVTTTAERSGDSYLLNGRKKWVTFGQLADVFLVFAQYQRGGDAALLVERESPGLTVTPIGDLLGARGSMLAELTFTDCAVPADHLVGRPGRALSQVVAAALTLGRLGVGAGCVGLVQGCLDVTVRFARDDTRPGPPLGERQLIQRMLAGMVTDVEAGRGLWLQAAEALDSRDPRAPVAAMIAKHFAAKAAARASRDAVQILGALGCTSEYKVERLFRDSKIMEVIEGSNEIQEITIGTFGYTSQHAVLAARITQPG